jgi:hypothetical protein
MQTTDITPRTPITRKADRADERVRLIEEAVLLIRGEWPAVAAGLCESVNRAAGFSLAPSNELEDAIQQTSDEAMRVVEELYGREAALEVRRLARIAPTAPSARSTPARSMSRWVTARTRSPKQLVSMPSAASASTRPAGSATSK